MKDNKKTKNVFMPEGLLKWYADGKDIIAISAENTIRGAEEISMDKAVDLFYALPECPKITSGEEKYGIRSAVIKGANQRSDGYQSQAPDEKKHIMLARMIVTKCYNYAGDRYE